MLYILKSRIIQPKCNTFLFLVIPQQSWEKIEIKGNLRNLFGCLILILLFHIVLF